MKAQLLVTSDTHAAATAAGRGLLTGALPRNPLVALRAALLDPVLGLGRRLPPAPIQIEKLRLERYRSRPALAPAGGQNTGRAGTGPLPEDYRTITGPSPARPRRSGPPARLAEKGGHHHG